MHPGVRAAADRDAAVRRLRAVEPYAVDDSTAVDMAEGCAVLDVMEGDEIVGAVAIDIVGDTATITGAASEGVSTYEQLRLIEAALKRMGVRRVRAFTRRAGLVRTLTREGYGLCSAELIKEL